MRLGSAQVDSNFEKPETRLREAGRAGSAVESEALESDQ